MKDVGVSTIGVAVKEGHSLPDISNAASVRKALLDAKSVGYSEGASGTYIANILLKKLGISQEVVPKSKVILGRKFVGEALVSGEVELGLQQMSELRLEPGIVVVGPLPETCRGRALFRRRSRSQAVNPEAAKQFFAFLSSPCASEAIQKSGVDLPSSKP